MSHNGRKWLISLALGPAVYVFTYGDDKRVPSLKMEFKNMSHTTFQNEVTNANDNGRNITTD
jgi:hypothetical protein